MPQEGSDGSAGSGSDPDPPVVIRPFGYVSDDPVVRRIGDREIFLGNVWAAHPADRERSFRYVLSATSAAQPLTTHHHPLDDGPGTTWSTFEAAVDAARRLHRRDGPLLVHCKAGISRSSALVATTLAAEEDRQLGAALAEVQTARPHAVPNPALHELAVVYLAARE